MGLCRIMLLGMAFALLTGCSVGPTEHSELSSDATASQRGRSIASGFLVSGDGDTRQAVETLGIPPGGAPASALPPAPGAGIVSVSLTDEDSTAIDYEVGGDGYVGYSVRMVDRAIRYSDSKSVDIEGARVLQIDFTGTGGETQWNESDLPLTGEMNKNVLSVISTRYHDGVTQSFVGIANGQSVVDVTALESPTRLRISISDI